MLSETRRLNIVNLLANDLTKAVSVAELSQRLGVSEMTIRRDLDWLAERSLVTRVHGGAVAFQGPEIEKSFTDRLGDSGPQKKSVGWAAAQLVRDGDRIILDAGTTTQQVAGNLTCHQNLTVITNNLPIVDHLAHCAEIDTIVLGGMLKRQELCTVGPMVTQALSSLTADLFFLSTAGFSLECGATDPDMREAEVKQAMIACARKVILVADSRKYGIDKLVKIAPLTSVHTIVTDDSLPSETVTELEAAGLEVLTPQRMAARTIRESNPTPR
jgi:DeoR family fructose operon transcriptional repressor